MCLVSKYHEEMRDDDIMESFHSKVADPIQKLTNLILDVALLVGRTISVFSEQFPGQELKCRVLGAKPKMLEIFIRLDRCCLLAAQAWYVKILAAK